MSHEALKFNIICNDQENMQPICGSVDFHSFYMIYIKVKQVREIEVRGDTKYIYEVEFYLQNYDGDITIGFEGVPIISELDENQLKERKQKLIDNIEGFHSKPPVEQKRLLKVHHVDFVLEIGVKPFDLTNFLPEPTQNLNKPKSKIELGPFTKPFNGCVLETTIARKTMNPDLYKQTDPRNSKYINPNHFKRAGDEILEVGYRNLGSAEPFNHELGIGTLLSKCNPSRSFLI